jgi:GNAT superfamily N-acetyltransferase
MDAPPITLVALHETDTDQRDLAGFVSLVQIERRAGVVNGLWMLTLYTKEAYRRRGIAQHLMQRCIEESRRLGFKALHLWTESRELTFYYAKRGWKLTGKDEESGEDVMRYTVV